MTEIIAKNKQTGRSFTVFEGTEAECLEKMICLKFDQLLDKESAGLRLKDYEFILPSVETKKQYPEPVGPEIPIKATEVPCGLVGANRHMKPGYVLASGVVLLETEKDGRGNYIGGAGMDGMYLRTPTRYAPVKNGDGSVRAFFKVEEKQRNLITPHKHTEPER